MSKKVVLKLEIHDDKDKQKALKAVSSLSGIESISMDMKDKKLTIVGDVDPIQIVSKLRKQWGTHILTVGPEKEPDKKKEEEEKKKKLEEEEKKKKLEEEEEENKKKEEERRRKEAEQIAELWKNYRNLHNPSPYNYNYNQYHPNNNTLQHYYHVHSADDNPNSCVVS